MSANEKGPFSLALMVMRGLCRRYHDREKENEAADRDASWFSPWRFARLPCVELVVALLHMAFLTMNPRYAAEIRVAALSP